jgi:hypothetical protein
MSIDFNQPGVPALDTPEGGRWFRVQYARQTLQEAGEAPAVVDAFERLLDAFEEVRKLHEGEPDGTTSWSNTLTHLDRLISHQGVKDLPRISNAPLCICRHPRAEHFTDPTACYGCRAADAPGGEVVHRYTPCLAVIKDGKVLVGGVERPTG